MIFNREQIKFMQSLGLNFDYDNLSDDDYIMIEDVVGDKYTFDGVDWDNDYIPNEIGLMCESILDMLSEIG